MEIWNVAIYSTLLLALIKTSNSEVKVDLDMNNEKIKIAPGVLNRPVIIEDECSEESENCDDTDDVIDPRDFYKYRRPKSRKCGCRRKSSTSTTTTARITYICPTCPPCPPCIQIPPPPCPPCIPCPPPKCPPCPKYTCESEEEEIVIDFG